MVRRFRAMRAGPNVTVGIQGAEASEDRGFGETNATLAAIHEFGSRDGSIPQRSFLRGTADRERAKINRLLTKAVKNAAANGGIKRELGVVGSAVVAEVVRTIDQSIDLVALKAATIARKGSTTPLIDDGILKGAITHVVHIP
jgi:hypothetical protein